MQSIVDPGGGGNDNWGGEAARPGPASPRIGWVGVGRMGSAMVERLLRAGYPVAAYNRTRSKLEPLLEVGVVPVASLAELGGCDAVFTSVSTPSDLLAVTFDEGGLLTLEQPPRVLVDVSTVSAEASAAVRRGAEARGVSFLAAPVSGNPGAVRAGTVTFAVSGDRGAYEKVLPLLDAIGAGATYCGQGEVSRLVKLCHNLFLASVVQALVEVTVLAEKGGVARESFLEFLNRSVMGSTFTRYKAPQLVELDFRPTFTATLLRKDMEIGLDAARELEVPMPVTALVGQMVASLVGEGLGEEDFAALIKLEARAAGLELDGVARGAEQARSK